ncbi:MAG: DHHA1 domain-containing protein, partial [Elusimicrobiota bacterium]
EEIEGIKLCLAEAADMNKRDFLLLAEKLQDKCNGVAVLFGNVEKKGVIMVCVGQEGLAKSIDAGIIARDLASLINGKGGGSADRGQAGGASINDISKLKIEVHRKLTDVFLQKSVAVNER